MSKLWPYNYSSHTCRSFDLSFAAALVCCSSDNCRSAHRRSSSDDSPLTPLRPTRQLAANEPGFDAAVEEMHERYLAAMAKLVEDHKHKSGYGADASLEILPPAVRK